MNKLVSLVLLAAGVVLIIYGVSASESVSSDVSRLFTGAPTDRTIWLLIGGVVLAALLLAEGLQPLQLAGGATILAAAYLVQRSATHEHAPTEADDVAIAPAPGGP